MKFFKLTISVLLLIGGTPIVGAQSVALDINSRAPNGLYTEVRTGWPAFPGIVYRTPADYRIPDAVGPSMAIRPVDRVQCFGFLDQDAMLRGQLSGSRIPLTLDQNRYFEPVPIAGSRLAELGSDAVALLESSRGLSDVLIHASEFIGMPTGVYDSDPSFGWTFNAGIPQDPVGQLEGYCFALSTQVGPTPPSQLNPNEFSCNANNEDASDRVFSNRFERGSAQMYVDTSYVIADPHDPHLQTRLQYTVHLHSSTGDVQALKLREQFPFHVSSAQISGGLVDPAHSQSIYLGSLTLDRLWTCASSEGANCGSGNHQSGGVGYIHLDGVELVEPDSCVSLTTSRPISGNGAHSSNQFTGQLYISALYPDPAPDAGDNWTSLEKRVRFHPVPAH